MGLSETIVAAMIGAIATISTALFQIFTAFKAKGRVDSKPKKGLTARSVLAVLALMIASAAGGFLYSELLRTRSGEDIRAMRQELRELRDLTAANVRERGYTAPAIAPPVTQGPLVQSAGATKLDPVAGTAESVAYVPACRRNAAVNAAQPLNASITGDTVQDCAEIDGQRIALCGTIPAAALVEEIQLFAQPDAVQHPWPRHTATFEQDLGGARFTGKTFEYAQGDDLKSVCVNFVNWSSEHPHLARILVQYRIGDAPDSVSPASDTAPVMSQTGIHSAAPQSSQVQSQVPSQSLPATAAFSTPTVQ